MPTPPIPPFLTAVLSTVGLDEMVDIRTAKRLPQAGGAYVLILELTLPVPVPARLRVDELAPGWYLYCGSAHGPGGLRARVSRHLRKDKKVRWHVDHLSTRARSRFALCSREATECSLVERIAAHGGFEFPAPGFGSSDCRKCTSHLLRWRE